MTKIRLHNAMRRLSLMVPLMALPLLSPALTPSVVAAPARPVVQQQLFGIVDFQECAAKSKLKTDLDMQFTQFRSKIQDNFNKLKESNVIFLNKQEMSELAGIYEKGDKATEAEKKRGMELQTKADQRAGTLTRLATNPNLKPEEKKELESLNQMQNDGVSLINEIGNEYQRRIEDKGKAFEEQLEKIVKDAVKKIAQEKNLAMVFNANVVIYAALDITEDVIKVLQK